MLKIEDDSGLTNQEVESFRISTVHRVALDGAFVAICHAMLPRVPEVDKLIKAIIRKRLDRRAIIVQLCSRKEFTDLIVQRVEKNL